MTRDEFIKQLALLGIGATVIPSLFSCEKEDPFTVNFNGKILIIGAGSAGLMAGYMLKRYGIDFQIIEATSRFGGRVKKDTSLADFPIDLGAEWLHTSPRVFAKLINDDTMDGSIEMIPYNPTTMRLWNGSRLTSLNLGSSVYGEFKFKRTTWYDFFEQYIVPSISQDIVYDSPVDTIDYSGSKVVVTDSNNQTYEADKVLVTAPIGILKNNGITFTPDLPADKRDAINGIDYPPGIKIFMKFSQRFYPDLVMAGVDGNDGPSDKLYYNAAFKKDTSDNILALFYVSEDAASFTSLPTEQAMLDKALAELDEMFEGQASRYYESHVIQNWSADPYIQGSYTHYGNDSDQIIDTLLKPVANKVYFAGEGLHKTDSSTVHGAGLSSYNVLRDLLQNG